MQRFQVYLPPDANCFLSTINHCLRSKNYTNLVIGSKQPTAVYLSPSEAAEHCRRGASIWHFASSEDEKTDPDVVLVGIGVEVNFEVVKAAELLRTLCPALRVRIINVTDLMILAPESRHPHALSRARFRDMFTADRPILFNYHGYATELQGLLFGRPEVERMSVEGYREEGTTTTPFDMMLVNCVSRFDVVARALRAGAKNNEEVRGKLDGLLKEVDKRVREVRDYIASHGKGELPFGFLCRETMKLTNGHKILMICTRCRSSEFPLAVGFGFKDGLNVWFRFDRLAVDRYVVNPSGQESAASNASCRLQVAFELRPSNCKQRSNMIITIFI